MSPRSERASMTCSEGLPSSKSSASFLISAVRGTYSGSLLERAKEASLRGLDLYEEVSPEGISSSILRERVLDCLISLNLKNKSTSTSDKIARLLIETIKKEFKLE